MAAPQVTQDPLFSFFLGDPLQNRHSTGKDPIGMCVYKKDERTEDGMTDGCVYTNVVEIFRAHCIHVPYQRIIRVRISLSENFLL